VADISDLRTLLCDCVPICWIRNVSLCVVCVFAFVVPIDDHISTLGKYNCSCITWQAKVLMYTTFGAHAFICEVWYNLLQVTSSTPGGADI